MRETSYSLNTSPVLRWPMVMPVFKYETTAMVTRPMPLHAGGAEHVEVKPGQTFETEFDLAAWVEAGFLRLVGMKGEGKKAVTAKVGAMEATVEAGPDGKLGTDDDKTTIWNHAGNAQVVPANPGLDPITLRRGQVVSVTVDALGPVITLQPLYLPLLLR